jgi:hypothetical protein
VNGLQIKDGTPNGGSARQGQSGFPDWAVRRNLPMMRHEAQTSAIHLKDRRVIGVAELDCARGYLFKCAARISRRAWDCRQDFRGGS